MFRDSLRGNTDIEDISVCLRGSTLVFIGGKKHIHAKRQIEAVFHLGRLHWIETRAHQSIKDFQSAIARDEVVVVVLLIRWASHSFARAKRYCDRYGKCFVTLGAGYNPRQLAREIKRKCGGKLGLSQ